MNFTRNTVILIIDQIQKVKQVNNNKSNKLIYNNQIRLNSKKLFSVNHTYQ